MSGKRPSERRNGPAARPQVVIFVKVPRPGRVKTRLARGVGAPEAARWFRAQSRGLIRRLAADPRWDVRLAVSPEAEGLATRALPPGPARQGQGGGDLGARMARALFGAPPGPVLVIGADIPGITPAAMARAFRALAGADAVLGPAEDGGFWLVGLGPARRAPRDLFAGARWSSPHALADVLANLSDVRVAFADRLADVDTPDDLRRAARRPARP
ncbi:MAG: TIGR04282 family arsenosugar biosynthesis glycosyltransferase [Pseudomonadota bacterium]|nr:TIGR04282 family arsenosugar biosynthesis glycosyltransferase [Pseudomonadota bacterium]